MDMVKEFECLIITGGYLDVDWAKEFLSDKRYKYVIAADKGLMYSKILGISPDYVLGDFDSLDAGILEEYKKLGDVKVFPREKDYTDTHLAIKKAIELGMKDICIIAATGNRMDHTFTNICNMKEALDERINCTIIDSNNKIYLLDDTLGTYTIEKNMQYGDYVSIIPLSERVVLTLSGFKYNLKDYELMQGLSICQSNEISEAMGEIFIKEGLIAVFETKD